MINEHHHFRKYSDKDEQSKKKRLSIKVNKITYKLSVRTFMHHLTLLLEKVADLFPLSIKSDGFLLLVHQIVYQRKTFHLESRRHMQLQRCCVFLFLKRQKWQCQFWSTFEILIKCIPIPLRKPTSVIFQAIAYLNIATGTKKRSQ